MQQIYNQQESFEETITSKTKGALRKIVSILSQTTLFGKSQISTRYGENLLS